MSTHPTSGAGSETSRGNPYPRALMICGLALIVYGIVAPAVNLVRNVKLGIDSADQAPVAITPATTSPVATGTSIVKATSTNVASTSAVVSVEQRSKDDKVVHQVINKQQVEKGPAPQSAKSKSAVARSAAEARARDKILGLYEEWKNAWETRDIDAIMRLYSPKARFRLVGSPLVDYEGTRSVLLGLWQSTNFIVTDQVSPEFSINGREAVLVTRQSYRMPEQLNSDQSYTHRFVWEHEDAQSRDGMHNGVSRQKLPASQKTRQWRIVRSEYLLNQGDRDIGSQIY